jgi:hypothetical protein
MFTRFNDYDNIISTFMHKKIFNNHAECNDFNIFHKKGISLSGSTALELYNNIKFREINKETNKEDILFMKNSNDIDIYLEFNLLSRMYLENLFLKLFMSGYRLVCKKKNNKKTTLNKEYNDLIFHLIVLFHYKKSKHYTLLENNLYFSLSKYIYRIINLENIYTGQKIDLIFIKCSIQKLLKNSFDFDIVKNYYTLNTLYIFNKDSINNKIATMTFKHFKSRVITNIYELHNFILRYKKYSERGYKIYIDNNEINYNFIDQINKILLYKFNIIHPNYLSNKIYILNNVSDLIYTFYINYFYINEELIKYVYHPKNIEKFLNLHIDIL